ncbi:MAG TPA: hypothetical protein VMC07_00440 [Candidatus Omnitrophota bacterium]|nr:hypothetical protein [Candidatus Omnitrophota bacterium]
MQKSNQELDNKQIFLLLFARELIKNSEEGLLQLKRILDKGGEKQIAEEEKPVEPEIKTEDAFPMIKSILSQAPKIAINGEFAAVKPVNIEPARREISNENVMPYPVLRIPEPKLPEEFNYLRPVASTKEIELGKLNPLINDPAVRKIECDGPNKTVIVSGSMGRKPSSIILSNSEVEEIVERFSKASRIPADVGIYKVVVGNLVFSAIISDIVPSRFVITKISPTVRMNFKPLPPAIPPAVKMSYSNYITPLLEK